MKTENKKVVGHIYFLYAEDELQYVGKTTNLVSRLFNHNHYKGITTYGAIPYTSSIDMAIDEIKFINAYRPTLNILDKFEFDESTYEVLDITTLKKCGFVHRYDKRLGNIQGTKLVKVQQGTQAAEDVVCSNLDIRLLGYMIRHSSSYNTVTKANTDKPVTTEYLAKKFNTTPQKVRRFLKKCIEHDVVCRSKKTLFMNPYTYIPYSRRRDAAENDQVVYQMQQWWDGDRKALPEVTTTATEAVINILETY